MEFLRYGSSIPGEYWGCCAVCIIQNFKQDPDTPASIQLVSGDGGGPLTKGGEAAYAGVTLREIFETRIRIGTFGLDNMPNHVFLAVLEQSQCREGGFGHKWLKILKENGFEFIRATDNSVYTGPSLSADCAPHPNYIFGLFRNITNSRIKNPFQPPKEWLELESIVPEPYAFLSETQQLEIADGQTKTHKDQWKKGKTTIYKESEVVAAGAPVIVAGLRSPFPPAKKPDRDKKIEEVKKDGNKSLAMMPGTVYLYN